MLGVNNDPLGHQANSSTNPGSSTGSTGFLGGAAKFFQTLSTPIFSNYGKDSSSEIKGLNGKCTYPNEMILENRLSSMHRVTVAFIVQFIKSNPEATNFLNVEQFKNLLSELPDEIGEAFQAYLKNGEIKAKPSVTEGFFAAMGYQLSIREIVRQAQNGQLDKAGSAEYSTLPEAIKAEYSLFLTRKENTDPMEPSNLLAFFQSLEIPEIESEKHLTPNGRNLKALKFLEKYFKGELFCFLPGLRGLLPDLKKQIDKDFQKISEPQIEESERKAQYLACITGHIERIRSEAEQEGAVQHTHD